MLGYMVPCLETNSFSSQIRNAEVSFIMPLAVKPERNLVTFRVMLGGRPSSAMLHRHLMMSLAADCHEGLRRM
jgi:hypothetical protein